MTFKAMIDNFCDAEPINVEGRSHPNSDIGALVTIFQNSGSMSFQHSMRPEQARYMAVALLEAADAADVAELARDRGVAA